MSFKLFIVVLIGLVGVGVGQVQDDSQDDEFGSQDHDQLPGGDPEPFIENIEETGEELNVLSTSDDVDHSSEDYLADQESLAAADSSFDTNIDDTEESMRHHEKAKYIDNSDEGDAIDDVASHDTMDVIENIIIETEDDDNAETSPESLHDEPKNLDAPTPVLTKDELILDLQSKLKTLEEEKEVLEENLDYYVKHESFLYKLIGGQMIEFVCVTFGLIFIMKVCDILLMVTDILEEVVIPIVRTGPVYNLQTKKEVSIIF